MLGHAGDVADEGSHGVIERKDAGITNLPHFAAADARGTCAAARPHCSLQPSCWLPPLPSYINWAPRGQRLRPAAFVGSSPSTKRSGMRRRGSP